MTNIDWSLGAATLSRKTKPWKLVRYAPPEDSPAFVVVVPRSPVAWQRSHRASRHRTTRRLLAFTSPDRTEFHRLPSHASECPARVRSVTTRRCFTAHRSSSIVRCRPRSRCCHHAFPVESQLIAFFSPDYFTSFFHASSLTNGGHHFQLHAASCASGACRSHRAFPSAVSTNTSTMRTTSITEIFGFSASCPERAVTPNHALSAPPSADRCEVKERLSIGFT